MNAPSHPVIETTRLVKDFGRTRALDGLEPPVKSTDSSAPTVEANPPPPWCCWGSSAPTSGSARVFGLDPWADPVKAHRDIAYVPGDVSL
ncbi:hypothetical protein ABIB17_002528 [Arthrobacter sp. UYEF6]